MRFIPLLALLLGCQPKWTSYQEDGLMGADVTRDTDRSGLVEFDVEVGEAGGSLLFTAVVDYPWRVYIASLHDPDGNLVYDAEAVWADTAHSLTGAIKPEASATLSWPILDEHAELVPGTYTVTAGGIDEADFFVRNLPVTAHALHRPESAQEEGVLAVNLFWMNGLDATSDWDEAALDALEVWRGMYADIGIELVETWYQADADFLRIPGDGSREAYEAISDATPLRSVNVVLIDEITQGAGLYGIAGAIPGPLVSSGHSAITVAMTVNAGVDNRFSEPERRLLGESMGHEVGHFLGLFHPVEATFENWDSIGDTEECGSRIACHSQLGSNLMFPYPICDADLSDCEPQPDLTDEQARLMYRYAGVE